jgi:hypothetical protein
MVDDEVFVRLLQWLAGQQDVLAERVQDGSIDEQVYGAAARHPQLDERLIGAMAIDQHSGEIDGRRPRSSIWLEPVMRGDLAIPMLSPRWDFRDPDDRALHFYLGLYFRDSITGLVDGVGFRYEAPHGSGDELGRHDYFHAQPVTDFADGNAYQLPVQARAQPVSTPAFPLEARTASQLLICLLISVYGGTYAATLYQSGVEGISAILNDLACCRAAT